MNLLAKFWLGNGTKSWSIFSQLPFPLIHSSALKDMISLITSEIDTC